MPPPSKRRRSSPHSLSGSAHQALILQAHEAAIDSEEGPDASTGLTSREGNGNEDVLVDRHDILRLPPSLPLPSPSPPLTSPHRSPSPGLSNLAPNNEEIPSPSNEAQEDVGRERKKAKLERAREERLRVMTERDREEEAEEEEDEAEPSEAQVALMKKLHSTLSASPNPSLLEMKILANHSSDRRFDFLRKGGTWRDVWEKIRAGEEEENEKADCGGLVAYGSDSESGSEVAEVREDSASGKAEGEAESEEMKKRKMDLKAEKAREWAQKRRATREAAASVAQDEELVAGRDLDGKTR